MTPRRTFLKHSRRASSTISFSQPAELKFPATRSKHCPMAFSRSQLFREISPAHSHSINASPGYPSPTCSSPAENKINRQLARMEFAVSHSKQTSARRINRQLSPAPSTPFFYSLCAGLLANEILERTVTRSKQTTDPSTRRETNSPLFAALPNEQLLTHHQSHLLRHLRSNFSLYPLLHFAIVIALLAFLPWGSTRQRPRDPWQAGAFPYDQPEERVLCAF
jgi:hypothetical protein